MLTHCAREADGKGRRLARKEGELGTWDRVYSCLLNSACVKSRTKVVLKFFGGSMSFTGFKFGDDICPGFGGCTRCETVENGRSARDVGNTEARLCGTLWVG